MITKRLALTEIQKGIYFDCQIDNPIAYNISATLLLEDLQEKHLENAFKLLLGEQEALRSSIAVDDDLPVLIIHDRIDFKLTHTDLSADSETQQEQLNSIIAEEIGKAFNLFEAPLFRARLVRLDQRNYALVLCIHHIISDGLSLEILKRKLLSYYDKLLYRDMIFLEQDSGFSHFIEEENAKLARGAYQKQKDFWERKLKGVEPLALPVDYSVREHNDGMGKEKRFEISTNLMNAATQLAMDQEVTIFMFFLASFATLLSRYVRNEDIVVSSPFTYRPSFDYEETIGCFVSMLPIRMNLDNQKPFSMILQHVAKEFIAAYKNIGYPNNLIMRDSSLLPSPGSPSIFDVSFVYDAYEEDGQDSLKTTIFDQDAVTFPGSMMVVLNKMSGRDLIKIQYKPSIFADEMIDLLGLRFLRLLNMVVQNVDITIEDIDLLLDGETTQILDEFNRTSFFSYQPQSIIDIFNEKVARHPDRIALRDNKKTETYASVNAKSNQLARKIVAAKQKTNEVIGVQLERSVDLVITLLAILKAGCAYVPIDADYPTARKVFILEDASINLLITSHHLPYKEIQTVSLLFIDDTEVYSGDDTNLSERIDPFSLAYIMYTSGSTGQPKGVMIEHHSLVNTLLDLERRFPLKEQDIYLLKTPFTFDVSGTELFGWFMGEGCLQILEPGGEKNPQLILDEIERRHVTHINFVPTMFRIFLGLFDVEANIAKLQSLKWIFLGGEAVTPDILQKFNALHTGIPLENVYGPTECTIWCSHYPLERYSNKANVSIGQPLNEIRWYVVGPNRQMQPIGIPGELCLSGVGLARGYLNRDDLTEKKFVPNPFYRKEIDPEYYKNMYRTGDLARWLPDGTIEFLGRMDFQIKLRGIRMELGEIENALAEYDSITQAVVVVKRQPGKPEALCAYYLSEDDIPVGKLRDHLANLLPAYMIPSFFVHVNALPLNTSGKVNRNALIADTDYLKKNDPEYLAPNTDMERLIASVWEEVLGVQPIGLDDNFLDIGGHSLSLLQVHHRLKKVLNRDFSITTLFQFPTVRSLSDQLSRNKQVVIEDREAFFRQDTLTLQRDIAIVGMAVRVPGADTLIDFWKNLQNGTESIHFYNDDELLNLGVDQATLNSPNYVKAKGRIEGIDYFDPLFFGYTPGEVRMMSPQLRLLYEGMWEALEDAGYFPGSDLSKIGIFIGGSDDFEWYRKVLFEEADFSSQYQAFTLATNHFLATRLAYKLDIRGPVFSALTGCSTSLVSAHLACQSLILKECDLAVAGGITIELPNEGGYFYTEGMMFSPDGHCRPFDAKANGTVFSNGLGLVILKRLDDAIRDRDNIYAVIKGSAINNDGKQKVGFVAPSIEGQADVIRTAYRSAGIDPETVSYVESHGTGTALGDPIEVEALTQAFATNKKQFCMLGSVKGNVGHTDTAAGVVGLIKAALCLKNKYIPGTVNFNDVNPKINLQKSPFLISNQGIPWELNNGDVRRAGVNSFGVGGTNAHVVLEEPPVMEQSDPATSINLLNFSAKSPTALAETSRRIVAYLLANPEINLSDAAWTLQIGRKPFSFRKSLVVDDDFYKDPKASLQKLDDTIVTEVKTEKKLIYFLFSGQGSQYQGMGRDLYVGADSDVPSKIFRQHIDQVLNLLPADDRNELIRLMYGSADSQKINQTQYTQLVVFATSYALAKTVMELGIQPDGMVGHSIGEVTAATIAGVFELKDAVEIVRLRGQLMQKQEPGTMLAIMAPTSTVKKLLEPNLWLALENTTNNCVVGGQEKAIAKFERKLKRLQINHARVRTSHAFHTPMMAEAAREFEKELTRYSLNEPRIPIVSNISGEWVNEKEITTPTYWANHILKSVNFTKSLAEIMKTEAAVLIEVGAGRTLSTFARQHDSKKPGQQFINLMRHPREVTDDVKYLYEKLGLAWCAGVKIDWNVWRGNAVRQRVPLPTYVFDKAHFPIPVQANGSFRNVSEALFVPIEEQLSVNVRSATLENQTDLESLVLEAYKDVLGFDTIDLAQDFFSLGGDSLKAVSLASTLTQKLGVKVDVADLFMYTSPGTLAAFLKDNAVPQHDHRDPWSIQPAAEKDEYPLSSAQSRMYALYLLDKNNLAYNLPSATIIKGKLDKRQLEKALEKLVQRHESLRTSFTLRQNRPVQIIHSTVQASITYSEKRVSSNAEIDELIYGFIRPFNLEHAPLFRVELVTMGQDNHLLLFDVHHIIADGTSVEIITRDFNELYFNDLPALRIQYKDFTLWQNDFLASEEIQADRDFWVQRFSGDLPVIELPTDFERPAVKDFAGSRVYFSLGKELSDKISALAHEAGATMFMTLLAAWNVLLARYSSQEDIIIGVPVAGRPQKDVEDTVGMFVNMVAMRNRPVGKKRFIDFLNEVRENALDAFRHQNYQFDELVEQLSLKRKLNRNALFDVCFDYQNMEFYDLEIEGVRFTPYQFATQTAAYDLVLTCQEDKKEQLIDCFLEYATGLFKRETIERMAGHFREILHIVTQEKDSVLESIDFLLGEERRWIIQEFNNTSLEIDDSASIPDIFERNAKLFPNKTALVVSGGRTFSYQELNDRANALARHLIELGVKPDSLVAVMPRRDESMMIALLGVLKAGGAYVPIDPGFPKERISYMLAESQVGILIGAQEYCDRIDFDGVFVDSDSMDSREGSAPPPYQGSQENLACVIFTSGSTGKPKGVMINQASLINFIHDIDRRGIFQNEDDRIICVTTLSFDIFGFESIVPLCLGRSIYLANEDEQLDPALANQCILDYKVTHILSTVSRIKAFVENPEFDEALKQLRCILSGGENYPIQLMRDLQNRSQAKLYNMYGPTETTIWSTTKDLTHADSVNIGSPIANTQVYIMNPAGRLQPIGVFGELCIAGRGLARGYLNNPQETSNKFVYSADVSDRVYKTGDRGRLMANGELEITGRIDSQVKIRGYRIELAEIEKTVLTHKDIRQAVVTVFEDKNANKRLVLYFSLKRAVVRASDDDRWLKNWLKDKLPYYMIPSFVVQLDEMPVLPNGKINRNALPLPSDRRKAEDKQELLPLSGLEKALLQIWKDVLNVESISIRDNFFDVGGNSLGLIIVSNRLNTLIGRSVPLVQLFKHPTIETLVASLNLSNTKLKKITAFDADSINGDCVAPESIEIAVIGMACKFPGADDIDAFWDNIISGVESIRQFEERELLEMNIDPQIVSNPHYVKAKGYLDGIEYFDSDFFDYPYQESNMMDPQIRVLHECVWEVLENAGYNPSAYPGRIGLFAGSSSSMPWMTRFLSNHNDLLNAFEALTLNERDFLTTRVSYKLNLKGPSISVQTACSTSLVAIHQAAQSILDGECQMAVAGGVSISYPRKEGYLWHEGMIYSQDGHCRPFADDASGTVPGNGCGVVLLKPLAAAQKDGDHIYAVIKGSAINNDGHEKIGYTAPSVIGQSSVIRTAMKRAGVSPEDISYLETHGTGTKLGDPIEIEALKQAWQTDKTGYCAIGSVKANLGHLDAAAGIAGFIKTALVLYHRTLPPQINFTRPNAEIDFANSPFYINTEAKYFLDHDKQLTAGVSSFGIGGTNVHVILEQPPVELSSSPPDAVNLMVFSAKSEAALTNTCDKVLTYLQNNPDINLSDVAWTLQVGRKPFKYRKAFVLNGHANHEIGTVIQSSKQSPVCISPDETRPVVFLFPASDRSYQKTGIELYTSAQHSRLSGIFKRHLQHVLSFIPKENRDHFLRLFSGDMPGRDLLEDDMLMNFVIGYSLAKTLTDVGVTANGLIGQGVGELTSLVLAGVLGLPDAVSAVRAYDSLTIVQQSGIPATPVTGRSSSEMRLGVQLADYSLNEPEIPLITSLDEVLKSGSQEPVIFITIGADSSALWSDLYQTDRFEAQDVIHLLPPAGAGSGQVHLHQALGQIWCHGVKIDWDVLNDETRRKRVPLPTYVFDRKFHESDIVPLSFEQKDRDNHHSIKNERYELSDEQAIHQQLATIWSEVLGCVEVHPNDDFFELGGHSLKAISLAAQIEKVFGIEIPLADIFSYSAFGKMAERLSSSVERRNFNKIEPTEKQDYYEVSSAQKRLYAVHEMIGDVTPYNLATVYLVEGKIDREKFKNVIDELVKRHESFRTRFVMLDGKVVQVIEEEVQSVVEFATASEQNIQTDIDRSIRPFDLSQAPLLRVKLWRIDEEKHVLLIDMHHIISDQSSIAILLEEFKALYSGQELPPVTIHYRDFAAWQNQLFKSKEFESQIEYWKNEFKGEIPVLNLLTDFSRPNVQTFDGERIKFEFGAVLSEQIDKAAKTYGVTTYMILISALKLLLWKYSGQDDLVVGTGIAGRRQADLSSVVGMFVNTLAIRSQVDEMLTVSEYLQYIKEKMIRAYENQDCQFEMLVDILEIKRDLGRNPLFDVLINYINMGTDELSLGDLVLQPWPAEHVAAKFDITWTILNKNQQYYAELDYNTSIFKRETMQSFGERLLNMVSLITSNPQQKLAEISIVTQREKEWLIKEYNQTETDFPREKTIAQLFEEQVQEFGQNPALVWGNDTLSYFELNQKSNQLAKLLSEYHVISGDRIAIMLNRGPLQIVSILAVLKLGCTYVPIDPDYPDKRINFMIRDSGSHLILTQAEFTSRLNVPAQQILLDTWGDFLSVSTETAISSGYSPGESVSKSVAYIMYTSGSTGIPKGTLITHRNVIRVVKDTNYITLLPTDRLLQLSNYAFDGSIFDIFGALLNGACLVMIPKEVVIELSQLAEYIKNQKITVFFITTALFNALVDWDIVALKNIRKVLFGGEQISVPHARKALEILGPEKLIHVYGPTETTVFASYYPIDYIDQHAKSVPIGYPVANTKLYILDHQGQLVPPNVPGELYIGGDGVGKGYLNRDDLTHQRFLDNPFEDTGKLYRTGDLVWMASGGAIEFIGRIDFQIKIRGFRVELGEIENHIRSMPGIAEVIVMASKDRLESMYIAAYYTVDRKMSQEGGIEPAQIRNFLSDKLPDYMIPSRMKRMESLPLNLNGKVDRDALPIIEEKGEKSSNYLEPRNELEKIILEKMQEVLDNYNIGVKDDFFRHGGQSIKAIALVQLLGEAGIKLKVSEIFQHPSAERLAALPGLRNQYQHAMPMLAHSDATSSLSLMTLNEQQLRSVVEHVHITCKLLSQLVVSADVVTEFPLSPVQKAHNEFGSNLSGFTTQVNGEIDETSMRRILIKIIQNNQLLHSVVVEDNTIFLWKEFDLADIKSLLENQIPYLDLREYTEPTQHQLLNQLYSLILLSPYTEGELPWRLCCLRTDQDTHMVIWGFDHTAFDGMSAEVIRRQIEKAVLIGLKDTSTMPEELPQKYQDYVFWIAQGPQEISEQEIIDLFVLNDWSKANQALMLSLGQISGRSQKSVEIAVPLAEVGSRDVWHYAFDLTVNILRSYTGLDRIPLALVQYGRSYKNKDYYNCVGEFLDIIPLLIDGTKSVAEVTEQLKQCHLKVINFLSLLFDEGLVTKFPRIADILAPFYKAVGQPKPFALFNFQGFVSQDDRRAFQAITEDEQNTSIAKMLINVNYDDDKLYIEMESSTGINPDLILESVVSFR